MSLTRKRRVARDDISDEDHEQAQGRRPPQSESDEEIPDVDDDERTLQPGAADVTLMAKKLVRLAMACEYSRQPIRRADVSAKVLGNHARQFKAVFEEAQGMLRNIFGMEMTELPLREKVTLQEKRAAQRAAKASLSSNSWVLSTVLPLRLRDPSIIPPPRVPTAEIESAYVGLYTFIISVIYLNGGTLPEAKLSRYLRRANADEYTPVDTTEKVLQRMQREGYITRIRDSSTGEEVVEYMVGPRGKVEVGEKGVQGLVRKVYGDGAPEDLDRRLERSFGIVGVATAGAGAGVGQNCETGGGGHDGESAVGGGAQGRGPGRPRRVRNGDDMED